MRLRGTDTTGSFEAWGVGFDYKYDAGTGRLTLFIADKAEPLMSVDFDEALSKSPHRFVKILEKTTQIKALVYSNNATINLAATLESTRLRAIMQGALAMSRYAFDLENMALERFCLWFKKEFDVRSITITHKSGAQKGADFFSACLETRRGSKASVTGAGIHTLLLALSDQIIRDIITVEFGYTSDNAAHVLLTMASRLAELSYVMNDRFVPERKITPPAMVAGASEKAQTDYNSKG